MMRILVFIAHPDDEMGASLPTWLNFWIRSQHRAKLQVNKYYEEGN